MCWCTLRDPVTHTFGRSERTQSALLTEDGGRDGGQDGGQDGGRDAAWTSSWDDDWQQTDSGDDDGSTEQWDSWSNETSPPAAAATAPAAHQGAPQVKRGSAAPRAKAEPVTANLIDLGGERETSAGGAGTAGWEDDSDPWQLLELDSAGDTGRRGGKKAD